MFFNTIYPNVTRERIHPAHTVCRTVDRWVGTPRRLAYLKSVIWITLPVCLELVKAAALCDQSCMMWVDLRLSYTAIKSYSMVALARYSTQNAIGREEISLEN
jgi:hypothetical protein